MSDICNITSNRLSFLVYNTPTVYIAKTEMMKNSYRVVFECYDKNDPSIVNQNKRYLKI